jgi:hypothetical protein
VALFFEQSDHCTGCGLAKCGAINPLVSLSIKKFCVCLQTFLLDGTLVNFAIDLSFSELFIVIIIDLLNSFFSSFPVYYHCANPAGSLQANKISLFLIVLDSFYTLSKTNSLCFVGFTENQT